MDILFFLLPASIVLALLALAGYFWSVKDGQFDDLDTPPLRMLADDIPLSREHETKNKRRRD